MDGALEAPSSFLAAPERGCWTVQHPGGTHRLFESRMSDVMWVIAFPDGVQLWVVATV